MGTKPYKSIQLCASDLYRLVQRRFHILFFFFKHGKSVRFHPLIHGIKWFLSLNT